MYGCNHCFRVQRSYKSHRHTIPIFRYSVLSRPYRAVLPLFAPESGRRMNRLPPICNRIGPISSQNDIEQIPRQHDEQRHRTKENPDQPPCHHLFEHRDFGQRQSDDTHHEGDGRSEGNALGNKYLNHRDNTRSVGIHRYGANCIRRTLFPTL